MPEETREDLIRSYYRVRTALGLLGLSLPVTLIVGGILPLGHIEPSISDYYHTVLRDIFVGTMCAIALFLISYSGHRRAMGERISDNFMTTCAGIAAFGVAFFPNEGPEGTVASSLAQVALGRDLAATGHYTSAVIFFTCLAYMCLAKFSRTARPFRRRIYKASGWCIVVMTFAIIAASYVKIRLTGALHDFVVDCMLVLWFEAIAIWAFSIAWLTKGRAEMSIVKLVKRRPSAVPTPAE
ncbi:hypothetical protein [Marivivens aquimaris]|uniref:hypothetical protein n=1 Tax=Marivivens aquimaris TaxID=2774876 RepID=UPI00187E5120|nr:hypothetical protein [Marivivens aquimaris]